MRFSGQGGVIELPSLPGWDPRTGPTNIRRFKGPTALIIPATSSGTKAAELQTEKVRWSLESNENGFAIIRGEYGADDLQPDDVPLSDDWEEDPGYEQKTLWELPKVQRVMDLFDPYIRAIIRKIFEALLQGETSFTYPTIPNVIAGGSEPISLDALLALIGIAGGGLPGAEIMREYFAERAKGVDTFRVEIHTVTRTRVVPLSTSIRPSRENVNKLFTTSGMTGEGFPGEAVAGFALHEGFYLKSHPKIERIGSSKRRITQTYEWCEYFSKFIYDDSPVA